MQETLTWKCKHTVANEDTMYGETHTHTHIVTRLANKLRESVPYIFFISDVQSLYIKQP